MPPFQAAEPQQASLACTSASHRNVLPTDLWLESTFQRKAQANSWTKPPWEEPTTQCCALMVGQSGSQGHHRLPHTGTGVNHTITATLRSHPMPLIMAPCHGQGDQSRSGKGSQRVKGNTGNVQTDMHQRAQTELWLGEECGTAQLGGPVLITANFSTAKPARRCCSSLYLLCHDYK